MALAGPFKQHLSKNFVSTSVTTARDVGDPIFVQDGSLFSGVTADRRMIVVVTRGPIDNESVVCILEISSREGDTLVTSGAIEGTADQRLVIGDRLQCRPTALAFEELGDAIRDRSAVIWPVPIASTNIVITHNRGTYPSVSLRDTAGQAIIANYTYPDEDTVVVRPDIAFAGDISLNF